MMNNASSSVTDLNQLIENYNPFDRSLVVRSHDIWEQHFPDVLSINGHVSNAVYQGIDQIRRGERSVLGITIRAEKGLGKSHLISRIRKHLQNEGGSLFVYLCQEDYSDLNKINSQFLQGLAFSLKQHGSQGVMQWQELAAALVNKAYNSDHHPQHIINRLPGVIAKNPATIENITSRICQLKPDIKDPYVVQAILWTLSGDKGIFAINWLAGKELSQAQADAMGLPSTQDGDSEARALDLAGQILDLISDYRTIIICFDEVEPKGCNSQGLATPQVVSLLAKDLYSKLKSGIIMMTVFPQTWQYQVKVMPQAESVIDRIGEKIFDLEYLNSEDVVNLVSCWLAEFYKKRELTPPNPVYPFNEKELKELGKEKPIIRRVLQWCCENWKVGKPVDPLHKVEIAFNEQLAATQERLKDLLENSDLIANAILLGFLSLEGQSVGSVYLEKIEEIQVKSADKDYLHFRLICKDNGKQAKIGLAVVQQSSAKFVSAALKRLIDYQKFDFTRGCLVRSKAVKPGTKGDEYLKELLSNLGGEWVTLTGEDIKPLLAILAVYESCQEYEVTEDEVFDFMKQKKIAENNYLLCEILSDPSGQVPGNLTDEDSLVTQDVDVFAEDLTSSIDELMTSLNL